MPRFPVILAAILRERAVCLGMFFTSIVLVAGNHLGYTLWVCGFKTMTGLPCPGCGLTRGMSALASGHVDEAIHWHPFTPIAAIIALFCMVVTCLPATVRQRIIARVETIERVTGITLIMLVALMAYGFWRMVYGPMV